MSSTTTAVPNPRVAGDPYFFRADKVIAVGRIWHEAVPVNRYDFQAWHP